LPKTIDWTLTAVPQEAGMLLQLAVFDGAGVHPGGEDGADRAPELLLRVLREVGAELLPDDLLVLADQHLPVVGREVGIEVEALALLVVLERLLEMADGRCRARRSSTW
jgi:hypothetical protein